MNSQIINTRGFKVENFSATRNFLVIDSGNVISGSETAIFSLNTLRQYEIHRIDFNIIAFQNDIDLATAYPKIEGFAVDAVIAADIVLGTVAFTQIKPLFNNLIWSTSDGISDTKVLREPFIFQTDSRENLSLRFQIANNTARGSIFTVLSGLVIPPVVPNTVINIIGTLTVEGVSYPASKADSEINRF